VAKFSAQDDDWPHSIDAERRAMHCQLQCIVTAFELLSGQGEAINLDLSAFMNSLYALIPTLAMSPFIEEPLPGEFAHPGSNKESTSSLSSLFFRALALALTPKGMAHMSASHAPSTRSAAFVKRLLAAALDFPAATSKQALEFVNTLRGLDSRLDALFSTEERTANGLYRPDLDEPELSSPWSAAAWEPLLLCRRHWDKDVRTQALSVADFVRS